MDTNELPPWQRGTVATPKQAIRKEAKQVRARQPQSVPTNHRISAGKRFGLLLALIVMIPATFLGVYGINKIDASKSAPPAPAVAAVSSRVPDNAACDGFTVKLDSHPGGNFSPVPLTANSPDKAKQELLDQNKYEPTSLYGYYVLSPIYGKYPEVKSERDLVDKWESGACYSDVGKKLYNDWAWYWKQAVLTPRDHMPDSGVITGATQDGQVFQQTGKINDSTGYDVSYPGFGDQFNHFARNECTQPGKAGVSTIPGVQQSPPGAPPLVVVPPVETPPVIVNQCPPDATMPWPQCYPPVINVCPPDAPLPWPQCYPVITTTTTPPPVILCPDGSPIPDNGICEKRPTTAPGNGGPGTGGTTKWGGGGAPPVTESASAPAVTPSATVAPTSKPVPTATQTPSAPPMTVTSVAPTTEKTSAAPSSQAPKASEIPTLPTNGPSCGDPRFCVN